MMLAVFFDALENFHGFSEKQGVQNRLKISLW